MNSGKTPILLIGLVIGLFVGIKVSEVGMVALPLLALAVAIWLGVVVAFIKICNIADRRRFNRAYTESTNAHGTPDTSASAVTTPETTAETAKAARPYRRRRHQ